MVRAHICHCLDTDKVRRRIDFERLCTAGSAPALGYEHRGGENGRRAWVLPNLVAARKKFGEIG
jgi:hypothetical protein